MAHARIRSVRFKDGSAKIHVIRRRDFKPEATKTALSVIEAMPDIAGIAIVVWSADGGSAANLRISPASKIPSILVPDFVRNRLLAERIEQWTLDSVFPERQE